MPCAKADSGGRPAMSMAKAKPASPDRRRSAHRSGTYECRHVRIRAQRPVEPHRRLVVAKRQGDGGELRRQRRRRRDRPAARSPIVPGRASAIITVRNTDCASRTGSAKPRWLDLFVIWSSPRTMVKKLTRVAAVRRAVAGRGFGNARADRREGAFDRRALLALPQRIDDRGGARLLAVAAELLSETGPSVREARPPRGSPSPRRD